MELNMRVYSLIRLHSWKILAVIFLFIILFKLHSITTGIDSLQGDCDLIHNYKAQLHLSQYQLMLLENLLKTGKLSSDAATGQSLTIYAITPTYWRYVQKAELTRISQTLRLVPNIHWIVVEDADNTSELVRNLILNSNVVTTHLSAKTPPFEQLRGKIPRYKRHRGVEQRNKALKWLRDNLVHKKDKGVVFFMDDDNTYDVRIFEEMNKIKRVGVWPVGLVGGLNAETPILDPLTGKVVAYKTGWMPNRSFAIDMAGFAINLDLILEKHDAVFSYNMAKGFQESEFLSFFTTKEELEPLADNCTKVYVWHTRTEKPDVAGDVPGLEV